MFPTHRSKKAVADVFDALRVFLLFVDPPSEITSLSDLFKGKDRGNDGAGGGSGGSGDAGVSTGGSGLTAVKAGAN